MNVARNPIRLLFVAMLVALCAAALPAQAPKAAAASAPHTAGPNPGAWLFVYFKEPGNQGIYFALSRDGYHYTPLNDGQPWVATTQAGELMRDVFLTRGPDGIFRMVWTWNWRGKTLLDAAFAEVQ